MRRLSFRLAFLAAIVVASPGAFAQARFRSGVNLVALDVCVKRGDGHASTALKPEDFLVLENGVPQTISLFSADGHVPLAVSLLVDSSQSMRGSRLERARAGAAGLIDVLRPDDLVEVMSFDDRVDVRYPLGPDHALAKSALDGISAAGATALHQAVLVAVHNQEHARRHRALEYREVIVLLSDGENTAGRITFDNVLDDVRRSGVLVYTISLLTDTHGRIAAPSWEMAQLAFDTGGEAVASPDLESLARIYHDIAAELLHLYRVGYVPTPLAHDGTWRRVAVRIPGRGVVVRTRSGYYAPQ